MLGEARQLQRGDVVPRVGEDRAHPADDAGAVLVAGDEHDAGQLRVDREAVQGCQVRAAVSRRSRQREDRLAVDRADGELDERCPRLGGRGPGLAHGQPALVRDDVGVDRVDALIRDGFEHPGDGRGADRGTLSCRDLPRVRERQRVKRAGGKLARQDGEPSTELHVGTEPRPGLRRHGRRIHRVRRGDAGERHDHLLGHLEADTILRLGRRCAEVRRQHDIGGCAERVVRGHRLGGVHVHGRPGEVARVQRIRQRGFIHDPPARDVEDERPGLRRLELGPADEPAGL